MKGSFNRELYSDLTELKWCPHKQRLILLRYSHLWFFLQGECENCAAGEEISYNWMFVQNPANTVRTFNVSTSRRRENVDIYQDDIQLMVTAFNIEQQEDYSIAVQGN